MKIFRYKIKINQLSKKFPNISEVLKSTDFLIILLFFLSLLILYIIRFLSIRNVKTLFLLSLVLFSFSTIYLVYKNRENRFILLIIIFFNITLRTLQLFSDGATIFLTDTDEMHHHGLAELISKGRPDLRVERMQGYYVYRLIHLIVVVFFLCNKLLIRLFFSILLPIVAIIITHKIYAKIQGKADALPTFIFSSCYRFLTYFGLFIYETGTFVLFLAILYIYLLIAESVKDQLKNKSIILILVNSIILLILGLWHYMAPIYGSILISFGVNIVRKNIKNSKLYKYSISISLLFSSLFSLNLFCIINPEGSWFVWHMYANVLNIYHMPRTEFQSFYSSIISIVGSVSLLMAFLIYEKFLRISSRRIKSLKINMSEECQTKKLFLFYGIILASSFMFSIL
ncbi:MAG: hypothetical protein ACFFAE_22940, partial [Candidatus Hodarchaeota archaeon]